MAESLLDASRRFSLESADRSDRSETFFEERFISFPAIRFITSSVNFSDCFATGFSVDFSAGFSAGFSTGRLARSGVSAWRIMLRESSWSSLEKRRYVSLRSDRSAECTLLYSSSSSASTLIPRSSSTCRLLVRSPFFIDRSISSASCTISLASTPVKAIRG